MALSGHPHSSPIELKKSSVVGNASRVRYTMRPKPYMVCFIRTMTIIKKRPVTLSGPMPL